MDGNNSCLSPVERWQQRGSTENEVLKFARRTLHKRRQCSYLVGPSGLGQKKRVHQEQALENCLANAISSKILSPLSLLKAKILGEN